MEKRHCSYMIEKEVVEMMERLYKDDGSRSKSEFVERALKFYCGFITAENGRDYFPPIILTSVKGTLDSFENRMAALIFKLAVEMSMMLHVTAANFRVDENTLSRLRGKCVNEVKQLNGNITFDDAVRYQRGK